MNPQFNGYRNQCKASHWNQSQQDFLQTSWLDSCITLENLTTRNFIFYNVLNVTVILGSILLPVVINLTDDEKVISTILGVVVGASSSLLVSYKFNEKWQHFRGQTELLKVEGDYLFGSVSANPAKKIALYSAFVDNVGLIKKGQITEYLNEIVKQGRTGAASATPPSPTPPTPSPPIPTPSV